MRLSICNGQNKMTKCIILVRPPKNWTKKKTQRIRIRTAHVSQFIAHEMAKALEKLHINHEFTHPGVPEENAFIESWHSIFQTEVIDRYEFDSFEQAKQTIERHPDVVSI